MRIKVLEDVDDLENIKISRMNVEKKERERKK